MFSTFFENCPDCHGKGRVIIPDVSTVSPPSTTIHTEVCENCQKTKEQIISQALESEEGKQALAAAMVEPIKKQLEYQSIGSKLLQVDELPQGALKKYEQ